jgi:spore coat polysaccharide biosynthesis protein SpsF
MKIIATIEARLGSKRLPEKLLLKLGKKTVFEFLINRLKRIKKIDKIVLATTKKLEDKKLIRLAKKNKINFYRGDEDNVLKRVYEAAKKNHADAILQVSGDSPFTDFKLASEWIEIFTKKQVDIISDYWGEFPGGVTAPVISVKALKKSLTLAKTKQDKEHVTRIIFLNQSKFRCLFLLSNKEQKLPKLDLCLDEPADYTLLNFLVKKYNANYFVTEDLVKVLKKNQKLLNINVNKKSLSLKEHKKYISLNK